MTGLQRRLGTSDAVVIGVGSMVGAGIFAALGPAAAAAGPALLVGLAVAAVVAYCNAVASAQLAARYPVSGGTYVYGRERLGEWWGFAAGWCFVTGKTASCAAMATTVGAYLLPDSVLGRRLVAVLAVAALTAVAVRGITRTARATRWLVAAALGVLAVVVVVLLTSGEADPARLQPGPVGWYGVLQSAGLLFFAFAGYARIATLGEEVRDPARTIPRAVVVALAIALAVYALVAVAVLLTLDPAVLARSAAPLATAGERAGATWAVPLVAAGAVVASLGSLLALLTGVGRTSLAMGRHRDLPRRLAAVHPEHGVPHVAQVTVAVVVAGLVLTVDLRGMIGFSSFGVLLYYGIANAAAWTQVGPERRRPRALNVLGLTGCLVLVATLPPASVVVGLLVLGIGLVARAVARRHVAARPA